MSKTPQVPESTKLKDEIVKEIVSINNGKPGDAQERPNLAIVQVGENRDTDKFVSDLEKESKKVGVDTHIYKCPTESDEEEIEAMINCLNDDVIMDGILITLPLPEKFNPQEIIGMVNAEKDLSYIMENNDLDQDLAEAKIFKACLENFKTNQTEGGLS